MSTAPNTGRRRALSPIDSRNHLLAEGGSAPIGMLVTDCRLSDKDQHHWHLVGGLPYGTPGSEGGLGKRTGGNTDTAPGAYLPGLVAPLPLTVR